MVPLTIYHGKHWTLYTHLSVEECLRRLRDEVYSPDSRAVEECLRRLRGDICSPDSRAVRECLHRLRDEVGNTDFPFPVGGIDLATWKWLGWMPLAFAEQGWILRKVKDHRFMLRYWPPEGNHRWRFYGEIGAEEGRTVIQGQFRPTWVSKVHWYVIHTLLPFWLGGGLFAIIMGILSGEFTIFQMLVLLGLLIWVLALIATEPRREYELACSREAQIVPLLRALFEAEEVASRQPTLDQHWRLYL
jgi:hypothetical protein